MYELLIWKIAATFFACSSMVLIYFLISQAAKIFRLQDENYKLDVQNTSCTQKLERMRVDLKEARRNDMQQDPVTGRWVAKKPKKGKKVNKKV